MSESPRRVAIVSAVDPYPSDSGKSVVLAGFLRHLRARVGASNVHYIHMGEPIDDLEPFEGVVVYEAGRPLPTERVRAVVLEAGARRRSLQETFMSSPSVGARVQELLASIDPDLQIIDTVRMLQHVGPEPTRGRRVLYLDDLFSVRYRRMLDMLARGGAESSFDPLGQFAKNIPARMRGLTRQPLTRKALLRLEANRIERAEHTAARRAEVSVLLNDAEGAQLRTATGADVRVVPPWVPQRPTADHGWDGRPEFVFAGLLSLPHNHDGLMWFLREGLPVLLQQRPDARLHVVGRGASTVLTDAAAAYGDRVVVHGFVPDLDEAMMSRAALINTLRFGSGVKIKTLDALARGVPIVATEFGAEGITATSRPGLTIVSDAAEAGRVLAGLCDPAERQRHSEGARAFYQEKFSQEAVMAAYDGVFGTSP